MARRPPRPLPRPALCPARPGRLLQGLNEDCNTIQTAIGDKVGATIFNLSTAFVGIIIGARAAGDGAGVGWGGRGWGEAATPARLLASGWARAPQPHNHPTPHRPWQRLSRGGT